MIDFSEILETIAHAALRKARDDEPRRLKRGICICQAEFVLARHAHRPERADNPAHFGHGIHRRGRQERPYRRLSRADRRTFDNITGLLESEGAPGTTSCGPVAICATSTAITKNSTKSGLPSSRNRDLTRCRHRQGSRQSCAGPNCWSRSKPSPCFALKRPPVQKE